MVKAIVIAGDYSQYRDFIRETKLNPIEYKYVCIPEHLLGLHNIMIIKTGEWWLNPIANSKYLRMVEERIGQ